MLTISEYKSFYETLVIIVLKCSFCGYRKTDVIPIIEEDEHKCLEVKLENVQDLKTLIFIPPGSVIEIPELEIKIELAELTDILMGNYVTVESILLNVIDNLGRYCQELEQDPNINKCLHILEILKKAVENSTPSLTVRVTNKHGNVKIVKTYRDNFKKC